MCAHPVNADTENSTNIGKVISGNAENMVENSFFNFRSRNHWIKRVAKFMYIMESYFEAPLYYVRGITGLNV